VNTRAAAVTILNTLPGTGYNYESAIDAFLKINNCSSPDSDFIYLLVKGTIQNQSLLDYLIEQTRNNSVKRLEKIARNLLRVGVLQIVVLKTPPHAAVNETVAAAHQLQRSDLAALINGVLRHIPQESVWRERLGQLELAEALAIEFSHPRWLVEKWLNAFGRENTIDLLAFNNKYQAIFFRHNPLRISWSEFEAKLQADNYRIEIYETAPVVFFLVDRPGDLLKSEYFECGYCSVQDYSQSLAVRLLDPQPGEKILDACAAPGGKATMIAQLTKNQANILANDRTINKIESIKESACRLGIDSLNYSVNDAAAAKFPMFDKILLDAPCSGSGVLARRADLRWSRKPGDLLQAQALQLRLLENLAGFLRDKGVLVYSTCSIEPEENWETVQMFLERHPHFSVDTAVKYVDQRYCDQKGAVMVLPFEHKLTGSFAIRLVKN